MNIPLTKRVLFLVCCFLAPVICAMYWHGRIDPYRPAHPPGNASAPPKAGHEPPPFAVCGNGICEWDAGERCRGEAACVDCLYQPVTEWMEIDTEPSAMVEYPDWTGDLWLSTYNPHTKRIYMGWCDGCGPGILFGDPCCRLSTGDVGCYADAGLISFLLDESAFPDDIDPEFIEYHIPSGIPQGGNEPDDKLGGLLYLDNGIQRGLFASISASWERPESPEYPLGKPFLAYFAKKTPAGWSYDLENLSWKAVGDKRFMCIMPINCISYEKGYVYALCIGEGFGWGIDGDGLVYLMRVDISDDIDAVMDPRNYEYYSGMDARDIRWSGKSNDAKPIEGISSNTKGSAIFHDGIQRYLYCNSRALYEAPAPWGPWVLVRDFSRMAGPLRGGYMPGLLCLDYSEMGIPNIVYFTISGQDELMNYTLHIRRMILYTGVKKTDGTLFDRNNEVFSVGPVKKDIHSKRHNMKKYSSEINTTQTLHVLKVPEEYSTIQSAIDAASDGDTVVVTQPGTYSGEGNRDLDFRGKQITVTSAGDPEDFIIDCGGRKTDPHRGFIFHSHENMRTKISGFTIVGGVGTNTRTSSSGTKYIGGGAILCIEASSPVIENCIFGMEHDKQNTAPRGGAVFISSDIPNGYSRPLFIGCTFNNNSATGGTLCNSRFGGQGGAVYVGEGARPVLRYCDFFNNKAYTYWGNGGKGGAIMCHGESQCFLQRCRFENNHLPWINSTGGAVSVFDEAYLEAINCTFIKNSISGENGAGGAIAAQYDTKVILVNTQIIKNSVRSGTGQGGGIFASESSCLTLWNCLVCRNDAFNGCAIKIDKAKLRADNITVAGNHSAQETGYALDITRIQHHKPMIHIENSIFWNDMLAHGFEIRPVSSPFLSITYCDIRDGFPFPGAGNISRDPGFDGMNEWFLKPNSPCIDSGSGETEEICFKTFFSNDCMNTRDKSVFRDGQPDTGIVDLGFHYPVDQKLVIVPTDVPTIQDGIDAAADPGGIVLIEDGIYTGEGNIDLDLKSKAIRVCSRNGPEHVIIDCKGKGRGFFIHAFENENTVVEGLTIRNGYSMGSGGGVACIGTSGVNIPSPVFSKCRVEQCTAYYFGGGFICYNGDITIEDCIIVLNTAGSDGGGIYCELGRLRLIKSDVNKNRAWNFGGGIFSQGSDVILLHSRLSGNISCPYGGGFLAFYNSYSFLLNCLIDHNTSFLGGGLYIQSNSSFHLENTTVADNTSHYGAGIHSWQFWLGSAEMYIKNSIISNNFNFDRNSSTQIYLKDDATDIQPWHHVFINADHTNIHPFDVLFFPPAGWIEENLVPGDPQLTGSYCLETDSPCIDAGKHLSSETCFSIPEIYSEECMDDFSVLETGIPDSGPVDLGYHRKSRKRRPF